MLDDHDALKKGIKFENGSVVRGVLDDTEGYKPDSRLSSLASLSLYLFSKSFRS